MGKKISKKFVKLLCDVSFANTAIGRGDSAIRMEIETNQCNMSFDR